MEAEIEPVTSSRNSMPDYTAAPPQYSGRTTPYSGRLHYATGV